MVADAVIIVPLLVQHLVLLVVVPDVPAVEVIVPLLVALLVQALAVLLAVDVAQLVELLAPDVLVVKDAHHVIQLVHLVVEVARVNVVDAQLLVQRNARPVAARDAPAVAPHVHRSVLQVAVMDAKDALLDVGQIVMLRVPLTVPQDAELLAQFHVVKNAHQLVIAHALEHAQQNVRVLARVLVLVLH